MKVGEKNYRTVWFEDNTVHYINQNLLPFKFQIEASNSFAQTAKAIKNMDIRGAGAIGATAGYGMAQGFIEGKPLKARKTIEATRPTAIDLFKATKRIFEKGVVEGTQKAVKEAQEIADENVAAGKKIGELGSRFIKEGARVLTHCNAGWLAFVDWGTALAPIYYAIRGGKKVFVYVSETRPRGQGARLTAWELENEGIEHAVIADTAHAFLMSRGEIDSITVGADRIAANGDTANKIGTLEKAICAKHFGIPFYVAAPTSTIDLNCIDGKKIPIEERSGDEVLWQEGLTREGKREKIRVVSLKSKAQNPAFDVTPAELVTAIITEKGIIEKPNTEKMKALLE